ncbi:MAG: ribosomal L7Ae/L30e/S12e/Gadd45 family protein [Nanoarchaeota archaeon]
MDVLEDIKKELKTDKLIYGAKEVLDLIHQGKIGRVFLASNCPKGLTSDFEHASNLFGVQIEKLLVPNDELGVVCKKQYSISVLGEKKQ